MIRFTRFAPSIVLAIVAAFFLVLSSQAPTRGQGHCAIHEQLTQEQRAEMHQRMLDLWTDGATPEEIHDTIAQMAKDYGIDVPEDCRHGRGGPDGLPMFGHGPGPFMKDLTQEQRAELHQKMLELWQQGATIEEIHDGTAELLKGYGIEVPENGSLGRGMRGLGSSHDRFGKRMHGFGPGHGPGGRFMEDLTDEQRAEAREEMKDLWEQGATPEEIHEVIAKKLQGYGVDVPEQGRFGRGMHGFGPGHGPGGRFMENLTDDQRAEVREEMKERWEQGVGPEEMHEAIAKKLQGFGVDVPEQGCFGRGMRGFGQGHGPGRFMQELTDEQRAEVRQRMEELWQQGASPQEIHATVGELMKGYGVALPDPGRFGQCKPGATPGLGLGRFMNELTTEQRIEVRNRILSMWTAGSTHEEIHDSVDELLGGYGIDVSANEMGAAGENPGAVPEELHLAVEASPNPFKEQTVIAYSLPSEANVSVNIFDMNGKKIRSFEVGHQPSGSHQLAWDGTDDNGNTVTNGPYLCRVLAGDQEATSRVMVIR